MAMNNPYGPGAWLGQQFSNLGGGINQLLGGGAAAPAPGGQAASGVVPPPNLLDDPEMAVVRVLRNMGINPASASPDVKAIRKRAEDLQKEVLLRVGKLGNADILGNEQGLLDMLGGLLGEARGGGKIFGAAGMAGLEGLRSIASQLEGTTGAASPGAKLVSEILSSPGSASGLFSQAMYGGMSAPFRSAAASQLINIIDAFQQGREKDWQFSVGPGNSVLDFLLGQHRGGGNFTYTPGGASVTTPPTSPAQAAVPQAAPSPVGQAAGPISQQPSPAGLAELMAQIGGQYNPYAAYSYGR